MKKHYLFLLKYFWFVLFYIPPDGVHAQGDTLTLSSYVARGHLEIQVPEGYRVEKLDGSLYECSPGRILGNFYFNIYPPDQEIVISMRPKPASQYNHWDEKTRAFHAKMAKFYHPDAGITTENYTFNNIWKISVLALKDTLQGKPIGLGAYYEKKSRGDTVVLYPIKIEKGFPYQGKYTRGKGIILHKNDIGQARIYYFYTDEVDPKEVDREIRRSWGFLQFKKEGKNN